jgi:predicted ATPase/AraC-like DNA-binding protein/tRNA A-37 threonylcarbamoyl transferase component Bud32
MINIPGYEVEAQISAGCNSTIYRGRRIHDGKKVVMKLLNDEHPTIEKLASFRREYEIAKRLSGDKIIEMVDLLKYKNSLLMVMEDFGGKSIAQELKSKDLDSLEKLLLAMNITDALAQIHRNGIIHKDINPNNMIWNYETGQLKIIDFGISSELSKEKIPKLYVLEGTLPYISPEQTGRINRIIDYRSDLYSLGIVLYELFTGRLPFWGDDLEIVHCHIAKLPDEPKKINRRIHPALSDIIMKLISKNAEDRYQSTFGLKYDLEFCLKNLSLSNKLFKFKAGIQDIHNIFRIPQKLYGRETEIDTLKKSIDTLKNNKTGLLLVSGYSGIGKTSIIREMNEIIIQKGGYFISGKFDQFERNQPYSALIYAFRGLVKSLIIEYKSIEMWKRRLVEALGANIKIIADLIPEITQIAGECSDVPKLNPIEEKNRFQMVVKDFVSVFATKKNPLVIFLDDLQWSDLSTIDLLKYLLLSSELNNLLVIGAYRDNEVTYEHPLEDMINDINARARNIPGDFCLLNQIYLGPLQEQAAGELIADTLRCNCADVLELTGFIYQKSKGNPFFLKSLLDSLYQRGVFTFNEETLKWCWNLDEIKKTEISDNVVEFLIQTLNLLPSDSFEILKVASCIGNDFSLWMLYLVKNEDNKIPEAIPKALWEALGMELIIPLDNNYRMLYITRDEFFKSSMEIKFRFSHDRIRDAIYTLIPEDEKVFIHKKIGRILLNINGTEDTELRIYEVTNHFNAARIEIKEKSERIELLDLNHEAGKKARSDSAYHIAFNYFKTGLSLLSQEEWMDYPDKLFKILYDYTESLYLTGHIEEAIRECDNLLEIAVNDLDKSRARAKVYELKSIIYLCKGENVNIVIDELGKGLQLFDIVLPSDPREIERQAERLIGKIGEYLAVNPIESLLNLPKMSDERKIAVMNLLFQTIPHAIQTCPPLYMLIELIMFDMAVTYGTTEVSCKNFIDLGMIQGSILGNYEAGYKFGATAFQLIDKYKAEIFKPAVYFVFSTFISHWRVHYSESLKFYDLSFKISMETGDMVYAAYSYTHKLIRNLYIGKNLDDCIIDIENAIKFLTASKAEGLQLMVETFLYFIKMLQRARESAANNEEEMLFKKVNESQNPYQMLNFGQINTMLCYFIGDLESAEKWNGFTEPFVQVGIGYYYMADYTMFQTLLLIWKWKKTSEEERIKIMEMIFKNRDALKIWSDNCPANFAHKYYLVCAETAVIQNESLDEITAFYRKALDSILPSEFIHMKALIYEMLGRFWLWKEDEIVGNAFIKEAHYFYKQWGASFKVELIEKEYPQITGSNAMGSSFLAGLSKKITIDTTVRTLAAFLDLGSIIKSNRAISRERRIDKLFNVLMNIIIENAGAQNGSLILKEHGENELFIEVVKDSDNEDIQVIKSVPLSESARDDFCPEIVQYAIKTGENIVIGDAAHRSDFQNSEYIKKRGVKSVLCMPIIYHNDIKGVIYLENNLLENVFTLQRLETLKIISSQISISIENAQLNEKLKEMVIERTDDSRARAHDQENDERFPSYIGMAKAYIKEHYTEPLTLPQVAGIVSVTPAYLSRCFVKYCGQNFWEYVTHVRIAKAKELLISTNLQVQEVAEKVGYMDTSYFARIFRRVTGVTPRNYRFNIPKIQ